MPQGIEKYGIPVVKLDYAISFTLPLCLIHSCKSAEISNGSELVLDHSPFWESDKNQEFIFEKKNTSKSLSFSYTFSRLGSKKGSYPDPVWSLGICVTNYKAGVAK